MRLRLLLLVGLIATIVGFEMVNRLPNTERFAPRRVTSTPPILEVIHSGAYAEFRQRVARTKRPVQTPIWLPKVGQRFHLTEDTACWDDASYLAKARAFVESGRFDPNNSMPMMHDYTGGEPSDTEASAPYVVAGPQQGVLVGYDGIVLARVHDGFEAIFPSDFYDGGDPRDELHTHECYLPADLPTYAPGWLPRGQ